jgi:hypothetical protein
MKICICNNLPGEADTAVLGTTLGRPLCMWLHRIGPLSFSLLPLWVPHASHTSLSSCHTHFHGFSSSPSVFIFVFPVFGNSWCSVYICWRRNIRMKNSFIVGSFTKYTRNIFSIFISLRIYPYYDNIGSPCDVNEVSMSSHTGQLALRFGLQILERSGGELTLSPFLFPGWPKTVYFSGSGSHDQVCVGRKYVQRKCRCHFIILSRDHSVSGVLPPPPPPRGGVLSGLHDC